MDASKLRSYAALAEIVSAGAIIVSLLYVGYEYSRTSTMSSREADVILETPTWEEWDEWFVTEARRSPAWAWTENRHHFTGEDFRRHVDLALSGG